VFERFTILAAASRIVKEGGFEKFPGRDLFSGEKGHVPNFTSPAGNIPQGFTVRGD
jgi:hypothetical protein